jgi:cystathionine gamma-synthase
MISIEFHGGAAAADKALAAAKIWSNATSLGGVESLWERRRRWEIESHVVPENLIRLSVGCENSEDLWGDITKALDSI